VLGFLVETHNDRFVGGMLYFVHQVAAQTIFGRSVTHKFCGRTLKVPGEAFDYMTRVFEGMKEAPDNSI
ncbi:MAG: hypothetical protein PHQ41_02780, partial [Candidatus Cloacimonetes bacterium]|nr:hypothetical protein [Candidatus Cloacimonadota bacterium]